jgi:hypothetical protein
MKKFLIGAIVAASAALVQAQPVQTWGRYMDITINTTATGGGANVAGNVSEFPLLVRLDSSNIAKGKTVLSEALAGGADVRFADSAGNAIPFEIEQWSAASAAIWVRVPVIRGNSGTNKVRLYWGKTGAASASRDSAVFNLSNGYEAVFHLSENTGDTIRDASGQRFKGVPVGTPPVNLTTGNAVIGNGKDFNGVLSTTDLTTGGAYRIETSTGGRTNNSFDYTGLNAAFTMSAWVRVDALAAAGTFGRRRGIVTKANAAGGDANDPAPLQWCMRPNTTDRILNFQRISVPAGGTAPYSVRPDSLTTRWTYVSFTANGAGVDDNLFRAYNELDRDATIIVDEDGLHGDVDVFIGGFANLEGAKGPGQQYLHGVLDEVRISKVSRDSAWVDLEFATQRPNVTAVTFGTVQTNDTSRVFLLPIASATYLLNQPIAAVTPYVKAGNTASAYAIAPALPAGLSFSTSTGVISGTPSAVSAQASYVVTATIGGNPHLDTVLITVTAGTPPGIPQAVSATGGNAQATVSWTAPASSGSFAITGYTARATQDTARTCTWTTGPLSCTITGLTNGTSYTFVVRATSSAGSSAFSTASNTVIPATVPGAPTGVTAAQVGTTNSVAVSWTAPTATGGAAITGYLARATQDTAKSCVWFTGALTCTVTGLTNGTAYTFVVRASNSAGNGAFSNPSGSVTVGILPGSSFSIRVTGRAKPFAFTLTPEAAASTEALTMTISDMYGRTVWSNTVNPKREGTTKIVWNGRATTGRAVSAGVYIVRVSALKGGVTSDFIQKAATP